MLGSIQAAIREFGVQSRCSKLNGDGDEDGDGEKPWMEVSSYSGEEGAHFSGEREERTLVFARDRQAK